MSNTIDQQFVEYIVKSLVSNPDKVQVERRIDEKGVLLELTVDQEDLGRVIGKRGATAQSLRTLLRALGTKNDARYNLKIIDPSGGSYGGRNHDDNGGRSHDDNDGRSDDHRHSSAPVKDNADDDFIRSVTDDDDDKADETSRPVNNDDNSDVISKTRKELEDLDDLDV